MKALYVEVLVVVDEIDREALIGLLYLYGIETFWMEEDEKEAKVRFYLERRETERLSFIESGLRDTFKNARVELRGIGEEDWSSFWKREYAPIKINGIIDIVPPWFERKDNAILIKPGMAFGTGYHPTTYLSVKALARCVSSGQYILDVGTGSGILSIVAAFLGGKPVGIDIDPVAIKEARENSMLNSLEERCFFVVGDLLSAVSFRFDVVVANILTPVILIILEDVKINLKKGGYFIASGITMDEEEEVIAALRRHEFSVVDRFSKEEWVAIVATT